MRYLFLIIIFFQFEFSAAQTSGTLVMPGDYPDPSVVKIGDSYWATATTSNWAPLFPLLVSKDLYKWETKGHVFNELPSWADYYFWAPEITYDNGKIYLFYSAHKKNGNLCLGVASASKPEGPYKDHGPLMCEAAGSIDAFSIRDENGKLFIIWKEDGNSVKKPTPIWAAELNQERTAIVGEKKELFRNDVSWEQNLVEGVSMIRHGEYFYAFYAGAGCCGRGCTYATGIARSKKLLGPWEKYDKNPIQTGDENWKCPGHGTPVEKGGKYYFLYHAYNEESDVYAGRQGILQEFKFTSDNWIEFVDNSMAPTPIAPEIKDEFDGTTLKNDWQWSVFNPVKTSLRNSKLTLSARPSNGGAFVGFKTLSANYQAEIVLLPSTSASGLALVGDDKNMIRLLVAGNELIVSKLENDNEAIINKKTVSSISKIHLRMDVVKGSGVSFSYSVDGSSFVKMNDNAVDGQSLPPWDRAVRVGLISKGETSQNAVFESFVLRNK
jgi:xylan 1,4-beta-xylosidase